MRKLSRKIATYLTLPLSEPAPRAQRTPLHDAARDGDTQEVIALIERGANIEARDVNDWTPLHYAAWYGSAETETVTTLIERGASIKAKTTDGWTPCMSQQRSAVPKSSPSC